MATLQKLSGPPPLPASGAATLPSPAISLAAGNDGTAANLSAVANPPPRPALFGGHKGGKKTLSGHPVDSDEHKKFVREREAQQKRDARAAERARKLAEAPPVLPPANVPAPPLVQPGTSPLPAAAGQVAPPVGAVGALPPPVALPPVAWGASDIQPLVAELVALTEELCNGAVMKKATEAKLPKPVLDEIEKDLGWSDRPKKILADGLAEISADALNATALPVVAKPYLKIAIAGTQIAVGQMKVMATLEKLLAEQQKQQPAPAAKPEEKKT